MISCSRGSCYSLPDHSGIFLSLYTLLVAESTGHSARIELAGRIRLTEMQEQEVEL